MGLGKMGPKIIIIIINKRGEQKIKKNKKSRKQKGREKGKRRDTAKNRKLPHSRAAAAD